MKFQTTEKIMKPLVKSILEHPLDRQWSLQGLGMLRLYLSDELRLHVWNQHYAVEGVSAIHTHPWSFQSIVIAGHVNQYLYREHNRGEIYNYSEITCGQDDQTLRPKTIRLMRELQEFKNGEVYSQHKDDIHESFPTLGTVTLCLRIFENDRDHAKVFWPHHTNFISAAARPASDEEILAMTQASLERYFK
jgi:hypothetical protein